MSRLLEQSDGARHRLARAPNHGLAVAIDVRDDDVAINRLQDPFDLRNGSEDGRHAAVVGHRDARHLAAPRAYGLQRVLKRQGAGGHQRPVLSKAVAHRHVRPDAVGREQAGQCQIRCQYGGLRDRGLPQILLRPGDGLRIRRLDENEIAQRLAEQRRHGVVRLVERLGHDRLRLHQLAEHVDILRALSGIQECDLGRSAAAAEDSLRAQCLPHRRLIGAKSPDGLGGLIGEVGRVGVVDGHALRRAQVGRRRQSRRRRLTRGGGPLDRAQPPGEFGGRAAADDQCAAQRRLARHGARIALNRRSGNLPDGYGMLAVAGEPMRDELLHHHMEIRPAETEGADTGAAHSAGRGGPGP